MPLYEVEHSIHLSQKQRDSIAQAITQIHTRKFTTPSFFVGVRFSEADKSFNYVGGEPVSHLFLTSVTAQRAPFFITNFLV